MGKCLCVSVRERDVTEAVRGESLGSLIAQIGHKTTQITLIDVRATFSLIEYV